MINNNTINSTLCHKGGVLPVGDIVAGVDEGTAAYQHVITN